MPTQNTATTATGELRHSAFRSSLTLTSGLGVALDEIASGTSDRQ